MFYEPIWDYKTFRLARRPDTPYLYIIWYKQGTRTLERKSTRTSNLQLAKDRLIEFADAMDGSGRLIVPGPEEVRLGDAIDYYLERHMTPENASRKTTEANLTAVQAFLRDHDLVYVADLTPDVLDLYPEHRRGLFAQHQLERLKSYGVHNGTPVEELRLRIRKLSDATIGRELAVLNAALRFYLKRNKITRVPFIQLPPSVPARSRWLTTAEFTRLYEAALTQQLRDFMLLAIHTLQRPGFLYELRTNQVDLVNRRIDFLQVGARQTKKGRPAIRISDQLMPVLERLVTSSISGYVLECDGRPVRSMRKSFATAVRRAGLHEPGHPHTGPVIPYTLRHSACTWLVQAGVDLWQIAGMMGHKDTRMVERVYGKHHPDFQRRATETLDRLVPINEPRARCAPKPLPRPSDRDPREHGSNRQSLEVTQESAGGDRGSRTPDLYNAIDG